MALVEVEPKGMQAQQADLLRQQDKAITEVMVHYLRELMQVAEVAVVVQLVLPLLVLLPVVLVVLDCNHPSAAQQHTMPVAVAAAELQQELPEERAAAVMVVAHLRELLELQIQAAVAAVMVMLLIMEKRVARVL